jgi:hypothetical protein
MNVDALQKRMLETASLDETRREQFRSHLLRYAKTCSRGNFPQRADFVLEIRGKRKIKFRDVLYQNGEV